MINFNKIVDHLFVGTCPQTTVDVTRLQQIGITAVLNLQTDNDFNRLRINWPELEHRYQQLGLVLNRVPIMDFNSDDLRQYLPIAVNTLSDLVNQSHNVYLHCTAGQERSPATAIAWLAWEKGWPLDQALDFVKNARPGNPDEKALREADALHQLLS